MNKHEVQVQRTAGSDSECDLSCFTSLSMSMRSIQVKMLNYKHLQLHSYFGYLHQITMPITSHTCHFQLVTMKSCK